MTPGVTICGVRAGLLSRHIRRLLLLAGGSILLLAVVGLVASVLVNTPARTGVATALFIGGSIALLIDVSAGGGLEGRRVDVGISGRYTPKGASLDGIAVALPPIVLAVVLVAV
jgi:hypothetical protein